MQAPALHRRRNKMIKSLTNAMRKKRRKKRRKRDENNG